MSIKNVDIRIDLNENKEKVIKLKTSEICMKGFRIDLNKKMVRGVPHRNQRDSRKFCYVDTCDSL